MTMAKIKNYHGQMVKICQFWPLTMDKIVGVMVMVNFLIFLTIDHGVNSRVSWSWSVPYPPPPNLENRYIIIDWNFYVNELKLIVTLIAP